MTERKRNRAVLFTQAQAEATKDSAGNSTVTILAKFSQDGYSQTNTVHLTQEAAEALMRTLRGVL